MAEHDSYLAKQRRQEEVITSDVGSEGKQIMVTIFKNKLEGQMVDESDNATKGDEFMKETLPFEDDEVNS